MRSTSYIRRWSGRGTIDSDRANDYMTKAAKEAKVHTSWIDPDFDYDSALRTFVGAVLSDKTFISELREFVAPLVRPGRIASLAQTLMKLTAPGVPDIYQGSEVWDLSLVDPDNRRPVDYDARKKDLGFHRRLSPAPERRRRGEDVPSPTSNGRQGRATGGRSAPARPTSRSPRPETMPTASSHTSGATK